MPQIRLTRNICSKTTISLQTKVLKQQLYLVCEKRATKKVLAEGEESMAVGRNNKSKDQTEKKVIIKDFAALNGYKVQSRRTNGQIQEINRINTQ